jgi:Tfp pilus assembly protein PilN
VRVLGQLTVPHFREQPAAEWGENYAAFLQKLGARHLAATVLLPRDEVTVRQILLPGVADKDLASAVRFEIDSLNPYSDEDVAYDGVRIGKTASILIGIARRSSLDRYTGLLSQAGVKVASFTFSGPAIYSALRLFADGRPDGVVALGQNEDEVEIYGESPTRPLFSARMDQSSSRARTLAISELRLPPETEAAELHLELPRPEAVPEDYDAPRSALSYAAAVAGASLLHPLSMNLLPPEQRSGASRLRYVPTAVLGSAVLLLAVAVLAYPKFSDDSYLALLQSQIRALEPQARKVAAAEKDALAARTKAQSLDTFRQQTRDDLDALNELTHLLAPPAWLNTMQLTRTSVNISGETQQAASLIQLLDNSRHFQGSSFSLPLQKGAGGEVFSIRTGRKGAGQ